MGIVKVVLSRHGIGNPICRLFEFLPMSSMMNAVEVLCLMIVYFTFIKGKYLQRVTSDGAIRSQCAILLCKIGQ